MFYTITEVDKFLNARARGGIKPGLDRVNRLLDVIDHPEKKTKFIHIAGTNGKGSTLTFMSTCLIASNYKVGTFTSPSIAKRNDMIQINHTSITDQSFLEHFNKLLPGIHALEHEGNPASSFEIIVALAFDYFAQHVDLAIIETGMGGLEDATNVINPILSIITTIGTDHHTFLGDNYHEIARHKAGIIKPQTSVIVGDIPEQANGVVQAIAKQKRAELIKLGIDFQSDQILLNDDKKETFTFHSKGETYRLTLLMRGKHQVHNATLAIMALIKLKEIGINRATNAIEIGISSAKIFGRFEQVSTNPIVIVDGAHNVEGITAFYQTVERYFPTEKKQLLFAAFADKPLNKMIAQVDGQFDEIIFTSFQHTRAAKAGDLYQYSVNANKSQEPDWQRALDILLEDDDKSVIFITGSLDFIGKVRGYLKR